jgi:hypothetical protein
MLCPYGPFSQPRKGAVARRQDRTLTSLCENARGEGAL